ESSRITKNAVVDEETNNKTNEDNIESKKGDKMSDKKNNETNVIRLDAYKAQSNNVRKTYKRKASNDPDVIYGRNVEGDIVTIDDIQDEIGEVVVRGKVFAFEERELKTGKFILSFAVTDFTNSIKCKLFMYPDVLEELKKDFVSGGFYTIKAEARNDTYDNELSLTNVIGIKKSNDLRDKRNDNSLEKRVELNLHTTFSETSVLPVDSAIKTAINWGHKAIAVTDFGCAQAFPVANHVNRPDDFKIIYGIEAYLVDDLKALALNSKGQSLKESYVVFDIETTGFYSSKNSIIEIGAVKVVDGKEVDYFSEFVNPHTPIPYKITELTSITDEMVKDADDISVILPKFMDFIGDSALVAHNAQFDVGFIEANCKRLNLTYDFTVLDTVELAHALVPDLSRFKLDTVAKRLKIDLKHHHRAVDDAKATAKIFIKFIEMLEELGITNLDELNAHDEFKPDLIKKARPHMATILVKNEIGRVNLNRLISASNMSYFNNTPKIPKSLLNKFREGLIVGSGNYDGELYNAINRDKPLEYIKELVKYYDYLEIFPPTNLKLLIEDDNAKFDSLEEMQDMFKQIVELGEELNIPVCATGDVFFLDPEDYIYISFLSKSKSRIKHFNEVPKRFFRTTEEMLEEFGFLGIEKSREVVVTNTNLINDMIEKISPVYPDKCPPEIDKSEETLTKICYDKAHEIYGPDLPDIVVKRLEKELNSIIGNGFAVMYIIAQKLVWDSNDHGYLVGSRGSVGSSFVATMSGITEVNPLPAHYICPECHYVDFDSETVKRYQSMGSSGCDMPNMKCPKCGHDLKKDGHDIPFETFLGFNGDKEPDIDLNFSGEYQGCAHKYTEVLFGEGHAFRAGTIGTVAEKTAYGYVLGYYEELEREKIYNSAYERIEEENRINNLGKDEKQIIKEARAEAKNAVIKVSKRRCELERLAEGCTGVKRTTGQHPGGIIVVPHNMEIDMFTAIQRPANDVTTDIITTHFEYHSIDHNLLKLDILGHDDPSMIRRMEDETGIDAKTIPLDDPKVMSLFNSTEALGITAEDIHGVPLGSLGVPELGTKFVIDMLLDTKPKSFSDLVRISGLSHGTDVWLGNAQDIIRQGVVELEGAICCRDDIMVYLINKKLEAGKSFTIMESVRKGKGLKDEWIETMKKHDVPDWYIDSCLKIKYMFPKAHAAAYVMMAWRIAWFKVYHPIVYYAAFFSIRAKSMDYQKMCKGLDALRFNMDMIINKGKNERSPKEEELLKYMRIVEEMYARGFEFMPITFDKVHPTKFQIFDGKLMPALNSVDGIGDSQAQVICDAYKEKPFSSKDDLMKRGKAGKSTVEKLDICGITSDMQQSDQLTFSFV
ncbi:MAG: PolC-type DNA polymerase III, partial [Lachnospiraceae bacterium]|nr:PolC-type DNA polymerase III [Lachnospiraceae bacterium]